MSKYDTEANRKQITDLKFALAQENAEYQKSTELRKTEFDAQTQSAFTEYEKRRLENEKKLGEELKLLEKHRTEVLTVRGVMLRDEIETLKKSRDEQLKSLQRQTSNAAIEGAAAGAGYGSNISKAINKALKGLEKDVKPHGKQAGENWLETFVAGAAQGLNSSKITAPISWIGNRIADIWWENFDSRNKNRVKGKGGGGWSTGGYTGAGGKYEPAGIVHRGEYVLPKESVNQSTGLPDWDKIGVGGTTVNVSVNMSGVMASGKSDMRQIAVQMGKLINEEVTAKTGKTAIQGI